MSYNLVADGPSVDALAERLRGSTRVGLDTEFHNERTYAARLMVLQLFVDGDCAIVDALAVPDLRPLLSAFHDTLVVGHALAGDLKIFADRYEMLPARVFDTQIAASFLGYGVSVSLAELVRDVTGRALKKSQTVSDWSKRPFHQQQIEYLVDDVAHLFELHDNLSARLEVVGRARWVEEECRALTDPAKYRPDPERLYLRIPGAMRMNRRQLACLRELAVLREEIARRRDVPLKYILADDVLAGLAFLQPQRDEDLAQLRRLDTRTRAQLGPRIIEAVGRALKLGEDELPARPARPLGTQRDSLAAAMNVLVGTIAKEHGLAGSLLVPRAALERVARELPQEKNLFAKRLAVSGWRLELVLEPLWRLLQGELGLAIGGYAAGEPHVVIR